MLAAGVAGQAAISTIKKHQSSPVFFVFKTIDIIYNICYNNEVKKFRKGDCWMNPNPLQAALVRVGLAKESEAPEDPQPLNLVGLGQTEVESEVRLYFPDGKPVPFDAVVVVIQRLETLGYQVGYGQEVESVESVVPERFDERRWVCIKCRSSLLAGKVLGEMRQQKWPETFQVTRITSPGIRG